MLRGITKLSELGVGALPDTAKVPEAPQSPTAPKLQTKGLPATLNLKMLAPPGGPTGGLTVKAPTTTDDSAKVTTAAFLDEGALPWVGGAGGAAGGYLLGAKVINPLIELREKGVRDQISKGTSVLARMKKARTAAPFVAGAIGALILATLVAHKVKSNEREKIEREKLWESRGASPPPGAGFNPANQVSAFY